MTISEQTLEGTGSVVILGHVRSDGDCLGPVLGLHNYLCLNCPDIRAVVYLGEALDKFGYPKGFDETCHRADGENYELYAYLDCGGVDRLEEFSSLPAQARKSLCLDHHVTNTRFAGGNLMVPEASFTCEVLHGQLDEEKIDIRVAECLYTGVAHDTGVFKYSCTSGIIIEIVGKLMTKEIDFGSIIGNSFYKKAYIQNQILGRALLKGITFFDGKCIFSVIRQNGMESYGADSKDMDGIIDQLRLTDGVKMAIFLYQAGAQEYKVSMRLQSPVDVNRIAAFFGGGGYVRTVGCTVTGSIHDVTNNPPGHIAKQLGSGAADRA